jgi:hypothetical protein
VRRCTIGAVKWPDMYLGHAKWKTCGHRFIGVCLTLFFGNQVTEMARRHGLSVASPDMHSYLSHLLEAHMTSILERAFTVAKHRNDPSK